MKTIFSCLMLSLILLTSLELSAQQLPRKFYRQPVWIQMMEQPGVNFRMVVQAYEAYWSKHTKPPMEQDVIGEDFSQRVEKEKRDRISARELREMNNEREMRLQCKRFEHWKITNEAWVKPDGTLMSPEERLEMWKSQRP